MKQGKTVKVGYFKRKALEHTQKTGHSTEVEPGSWKCLPAGCEQPQRKS